MANIGANFKFSRNCSLFRSLNASESSNCQQRMESALCEKCLEAARICAKKFRAFILEIEKISINIYRFKREKKDFQLLAS